MPPMLTALLPWTMTLAAQAAPMTVALLYRPDPAVGAAVVSKVQTEVRAVLERAGTLRVQGTADTALSVEQAMQAGWQCDDANACLAVLGKALAVSTVVVVKLTGNPAAPTLAVRMVDVASASECGHAEATLPQDVTQWGALLRSVVEALPLSGGMLRLHLHAPAAQVTVDKKVYDAPGTFLLVGGLAPGKHVVHVIMEDLTDVEQKVDVAPNGITGAWVSAEQGTLRMVMTQAVEVAPAHVASAAALDVQPRPTGMRRAALATGMAGVAAGAACVVAWVVAVAAGVAGTYVLIRLPREPRSGHVMAAEGQSRLSVNVMLTTGVGLWGAGLVLCGLSLLGAVASAALTGVGLGMMEVEARRAEVP